MSEQHSLYIKVRITEEKLHEFFLSKPDPIELDQNWIEWWDTRKMYSKAPLDPATIYIGETNRSIVDEYLSDPRTGAMEEFDPLSGEWTLCILYYSENYTEILPMLAMLDGLSNYLENGQDGVMIIYDFIWGGDEVMAYMHLSSGKASLKDFTNTAELEETVFQQANQTLEACEGKLRELYK